MYTGKVQMNMHHSPPSSPWKRQNAYMYMFPERERERDSENSTKKGYNPQ